MEDNTRKESRAARLLKLLLKIAVTVACLWYVSGKIDFAKAWTAIRNANWFYLFLAFDCFHRLKTNCCFQAEYLFLQHRYPFTRDAEHKTLLARDVL